MSHVIIEIKARCNRHDFVRSILKETEARSVGLDHQVDTYFKVSKGRLKLREGTIEQNLIRYHRPNQEGPKRSDVTLYKPTGDPGLKEILVDTMGVLVVVDKHREIYFVDNVKIHLDKVENLGTFVEIEAIDFQGTIGPDKLHEQCEYWMKRFEIKESDLVTCSYSDLLLEMNSTS